MKTLAIAMPAAILAALLAGCTSPGTKSAASEGAVKTVEHPYWAGTGVVQAVTPAPRPIEDGKDLAASSGTKASASGATSAAASDTGMQRLRIRMDNGKMMFVDTPSRDFPVGTRVQVTEANQISRMQ